MKRFLVIVCSLLMLVAGAASAWADCKQISSTFDDQRHAVSSSAHDHHSDSHHKHSDGSQVHCPIIEEFVPTVVLSLKTGGGPERLLDPFTAELIFRMSSGEFHPLMHGPPILTRTTSTPSHIFLSVLRI